MESERLAHEARARDAEAGKHEEKAAAAQTELDATRMREKNLGDKVLGAVGMSQEQRRERKVVGQEFPCRKKPSVTLHKQMPRERKATEPN
mmetsp:Transcript_19344/g.33268  ORF Transcript_19344/g.33268 Transcript_19344/m.33268 type:complete len:91 (+) Transcript_19344:165-437(+)|eukprot:CAMPEP_0196660594 /NCGR_PEP_ID=MMETSP1086-20130531/40534_1 /TAXON_ID=77921 /ORGANISM="Cyanoptyche  gloeocystis , Strain SAG4.97" /LENGTH=90 /DNA_ID=CAMNT_0041995081 /DNA_START=165 /DNA_END=437 /DNA_ORIENTATION=-